MRLQVVLLTEISENKKAKDINLISLTLNISHLGFLTLSELQKYSFSLTLHLIFEK